MPCGTSYHTGQHFAEVVSLCVFNIESNPPCHRVCGEYCRGCMSKRTNSMASMSSVEKNTTKGKGGVVRVVISGNGGAGELASGQNACETPPCNDRGASS